MPVVVRNRGRGNRIECRICGGRYRALNHVHLRLHPGLDRSHPVLDYKRRFDVPCADSEATRRKKRRKVILYFRRLGRAWSRARVIRELRDRFHEGRSVARAVVAREHRKLVAAAKRRYDSWRDACRAARVPFQRASLARRWTARAVVQVVRARYRRGRPIHRLALHRELSGLDKAALRHFGSWEGLCRAAGVPYRPRRLPRPTRRAAVQRLREIARRKGALRTSILKAEGSAFCQSVRMVFGSIREACRAARVPFVPLRREWTRKSILRAIRRRRRAGRCLHYAHVETQDPGLLSCAVSRFDSWEAACRAAGVPCPRLNRSWSIEKVLREIRRRRDRGVSLVGAAVDRHFPSLHRAACRRFRTWEAACRAAGIRGKVGRIS